MAGVTSASVRPRQGRISACRPVTRSERLSFVPIRTVRFVRESASAVYAVSDIASRKFPPSETKTFPRPSCIALTDFCESKPCSRGGWKSNALPRRIQELGPRPLPHAHRPVALHVRVPADADTAPAPGLAIAPANRSEVEHFLHVARSIVIQKYRVPASSAG